MAGLPLDLSYSRLIIPHTEAARCLTMAGFTVVVWDHLCTIDQEIQFWWTAPRSVVKYLFLLNRYVTPIGQAVAVFYMSRLAVLSDLSCRRGMISVGFVETASLALWDLLLLFRVHALWGGSRSVVVGTSILYLLTNSCHTVIAVISAIQLAPHIHYDPFAKACITDHRPPLMSIIWTFVLTYEIIVFILTLIKVVERRASNQMHSPLIASLHYGQLIYNVVVIAVRSFNLLIWSILPPSFTFLGVFFLWAMATALVTRMMLHLRKVAYSNPEQSETSSLGDPAVSTGMVWARQTGHWNSSRTAFSWGVNLAVTKNEEVETGDGIVLRTLPSRGQPD